MSKPGVSQIETRYIEAALARRGDGIENPQRGNVSEARTPKTRGQGGDENQGIRKKLKAKFGFIGVDAQTVLNTPTDDTVAKDYLIEEMRETSKWKGGRPGEAELPQASSPEKGDEVIYFQLPQEKPQKKGNVGSLLHFRQSLNQEEENLRSTGVPEIRAASFEKLISVLINRLCTAKFRRAFLLSFPTFTDSVTFLRALISTYTGTDMSSSSHRNTASTTLLPTLVQIPPSSSSSLNSFKSPQRNLEHSPSSPLAYSSPSKATISRNYSSESPVVKKTTITATVTTISKEKSNKPQVAARPQKGFTPVPTPSCPSSPSSFSANPSPAQGPSFWETSVIIPTVTTVPSQARKPPPVRPRPETRSQVILILTEWIKNHYEEDFLPHSQTRNILSQFMKELPASESEKLADQLASSCSPSVDDTLAFPVPEKKETVPGGVDSFGALEIAECLTIYSYSLFKRTREREYFHWLEGQEDSSHLHQNLTSMIAFFNRTAGWVTTEIVTRLRLMERVGVIEKFILVAKRLWEMGNFLALKAVQSGLSSGAVNRLKKTWDHMPCGSSSDLTEIETVLSYEKNYKTYRLILEDQPTPCVPYIGVHQKDIFFLNDGNPDKVSDLINFSKRTRICEIIFDLSFLKTKGLPVQTKSNRFLTWFDHKAPVMTENETYVWSRRMEPKDPEMAMAEMIKGEMKMLAHITELEKELSKAITRIQELETRYEPSQRRREYAARPRNTGAMRLSVSPARMNDLFNSRTSKSEPSKWSKSEVCEWVKSVVGVQWVPPFANAEILGADLIEMSEGELAMLVDDPEICQILFTKLMKLR